MTPIGILANYEIPIYTLSIPPIHHLLGVLWKNRKKTSALQPSTIIKPEIHHSSMFWNLVNIELANNLYS